jgi:purine-binding chemotaxis protein CheW
MPAPRRQVVVFSLGEEEYAFPVADVREIIGAAAPRPVPSPDPAVRGIISLRGRIVGVVDLATRLGVAGRTGGARKIMILEAPDGVSGVVVDDVTGVLTVDEEQIERLPVGADGGTAAVVNLGDRVIALLDRSMALYAALAAR